MKKTLLSVCLALITGMAAQAQGGVYQIPNSDFNTWASDNEPGNGWNSFASAGGTLISAAGMSPQPSKDAGRSGAADDYSCKIYSKSIFGVKANGNLTTGRINMGSMSPANSSNYNYTDRTSDSHSLLFAGRPDAVEFYAKFTSGGSPNGRGQFILHGDVDYRDPETSDQEAYKVGIASVPVPASDDWQLYRGEFTYSQDTPATQYMLASFTTNPTPGGSQDDYLWIDDVNFIYYHSLTALSYEGASLSFDEGTLSYDLSSVDYDASKLSYTKKGAGATVETAYDETSGLLTITVKGNDFAANPASVTAYTIQFDNTTEPIIPEEPQLGAKLSSLSEASTEKTYVLYNEHFTAYAIYNGAQSETNVWTAGMIGDAGHELSNASYGEALDVTDAGSCWMVIEKEGRYFLYNVGAGKYLTTPPYGADPAICTFEADSVSLSVADLGNGNFAFNATDGEYGYMCAAPQLTSPLSIWTSDDAGSAWQLIENPNVAADASVVEYLLGTTPDVPEGPEALGEKELSLSNLSTEKTYVLYNEHFTAYAVYNGAQSETNVWTAEMIGDDSHPLANAAYAEALDVTDAGSSWMVVEKDGSYYLYNMGAGKFLTTPGYVNATSPCTFSEEPVALTAVSLGDGNFAFTATGHELDYMCAAPNGFAPVSIWTSTDAGSAWQLKENPNVEADPDVLNTLTGISAAPAAPAKEGIYSLSGLKLGTTSKSQLPAGIYIVNGKKVVVGK